MHRLNGLESAFLQRENDTQNANTGTLIRLRLDDPSRPITLDALRAHLATRLDLVPSFRQRVYEVPLGLHHAVLADDPDFGLDRHVGEQTLPSPGDDATLHSVFAAATTKTFDRTHPVWRLTLIDGLADGNQALFFIFNHILMDGVGYISTLDGLFTDEAPSKPYARPHRPEHPSKARLFGSALKDQAVALVHAPKLYKDLRVGRAAMAARIAETADQVPPPPPARPPVNPAYQPSIERAFAVVDLPFDDVRTVRQGGDVTINTVLLAVVAISLKRYLERRQQLPEDPLATGVMASTEPLDAPPRQDGNCFANYMISLATDVEDPWEQMQAISAASAEGKTRLERLGLDIQNRLLEYLPPGLGVRLNRRASARQAAVGVRMRASVSFSNVRGAPGYHFLGATISGLYTYGPIADAIGLFISSTNLGDHFHLVVMANPSALDDPTELASSFTDTLRELATLAADRTAPG